MSGQLDRSRPAGRRRGTIAALAIGALGITTLGAAGSPSPAANPGANDDPSTPKAAEVVLTEGTNLTAAAAPDGSTVIDLHGALYRVPEGGGQATQLSSPLHEAARPDVGPDGSIAYQSYADGGFHIWIASADGSEPTQVTEGSYDEREPRWSPDGEHIAFASDREGSYDIWSVEVATGELTRWTDSEGEEAQPSWSPDGDEIAHVAGNTIAAVNSDGDSRVLVPDPGGTATVNSPAFSPYGDSVAWTRHDGTSSDLMVDDQAVTEGEDVFLFTPEWLDDDTLRYTADGGIRDLDLATDSVAEVPFEATVEIPGADYTKKEHDFDDRDRRSATILTPQLSPDGSSVLFVALGDLWHMEIGAKPKQLTDDDFHEVDPVFSPDGGSVAYASDKAGTEDLYVRDLATGEERRVTSLDGAEVAPAFSPNGKQLAFQDQNGATYTLDLASRYVKELVPSIFGPGRPTWSADGDTIALAAVVPYSERFREGTSQILTVDVASGEQTFHSPGDSHASLSTRGDDGPVWSPDGASMAFVVDSLLRTMPVDDDGTPSGPVSTVNDDVADAPSWSADSRQLLYLSGGDLRLADVTTGEARTIEVPLDFRPAMERGMQTIHAGAFWDGESRHLREDVDITVRHNRIVSVEDHDKNRHHRGKLIDASDLTVMPGLMDSHVHQAYQSRFFGDRQGRISLAYGITSTLSVGDQVYRAMEDRDSLDAGERVGPRFYATGEPIDGARVYYNFMRPTTSMDQIDRELTRAEDLDYDFLKTYVRLPAERMAKVVQAAHDMGLPSASHYLSPGAFVGQDGTTHLAATQRLGYARTISATGQSYSDVPTLYGEGNRMVTSTLFTSDFLQPEEFLSDPRFGLLPSWKQQSLMDGIGDNTGDPSDPDCVTAECSEVQTLDRIREAGGQVLVGTDSPLDQVAIGVHANLRELVGYGWDPYDALRAATVAPARYLGVDDQVGTLEPGKVADLIAVRGNPLEDIDATMNVELTVVGGEVHTQEELLAPFDGTVDSSDDSTSWSDHSASEVNEWADESVTDRYWWHASEVVAEAYDHACDAYDELAHRAAHGSHEEHAHP
nr:amidohydrolase family protein [Ornithinimicrobium sp. HY1745]